MSKFKEYLLKKKPLRMEVVNERDYKYIWIEKAEKISEKGRGKRPTEVSRRRSPDRRRRSALDKIQAPNRG
ncbi:hypothetical protein LIER_27384 [Lithospermum erythrorhizon]|uniref:Uncharacterized protein n=1 Tax=Lithospermum erythrorhizon TaxID=34254 RepID=A0AAV3RFA5_LITER